MELLAFLVFASQEAVSWDGLLVFYMSLITRALPPGYERGDLEAASPAEPAYLYIRTYRNELADWVSRADYVSQGPMHRRLVMSRIRALAERDFIPTNEELAQAVSMEHLANLVAERARATTGQAESDAESSESGRGPGS